MSMFKSFGTTEVMFLPHNYLCRAYLGSGWSVCCRDQFAVADSKRFQFPRDVYEAKEFCIQSITIVRCVVLIAGSEISVVRNFDDKAVARWRLTDQVLSLLDDGLFQQLLACERFVQVLFLASNTLIDQRKLRASSKSLPGFHQFFDSKVFDTVPLGTLEQSVTKIRIFRQVRSKYRPVINFKLDGLPWRANRFSSGCCTAACPVCSSAQQEPASAYSLEITMNIHPVWKTFLFEKLLKM